MKLYVAKLHKTDKRMNLEGIYYTLNKDSKNAYDKYIGHYQKVNMPIVEWELNQKNMPKTFPLCIDIDFVKGKGAIIKGFIDYGKK